MMVKKILGFLSFMLLTYYSPTLLASQIQSISFEESGYRLETILSGKVEVSYFFLDKPNRAVLDFRNTKNKSKFPKIKSSNISLRVRGGSRNNDYRVVVDLKKPVSMIVSQQYDEGAKTTLVTLDLKEAGHVFSVKKKPLAEKHTSKLDKSTVKIPVRKEIKSSKKIADKKRVVLIAIDAGHGGKDPGAISPSGIREKDVVLAIAKKLETYIDNEEGFYSKSIRHHDIYVDLKTRSDVARSKKADLFISIHADAFPDERVKGASIYVLSDKGASSATAKFLAQKENEKGGLGRASIEGADAILKEVLVDLSMNDKLSESVNIGTAILSNLGKVTKLHSDRVERAAFAVLKTPDVPSVLIETGFISNQSEARKLSDSMFQERIARSIFYGIKDYFYKNPPQGSYLAWKQQ